MDKSQKRKLTERWRAQQRGLARAEFPLAVDELKALFAMLDESLAERSCDHSRTLTTAWLRTHHSDSTEEVLLWLAANGGYCDCEILGNVEQQVDDAIKESDSSRLICPSGDAPPDSLSVSIRVHPWLIPD